MPAPAENARSIARRTCQKAAAFLGTPPGECGGGKGKGERRGVGSPGLHAPGSKRSGGSFGDTLALGSGATNPFPCRGQQPPLKATLEGGVPLLRTTVHIQARQARAHRHPRALLGYLTKEIFV